MSKQKQSGKVAIAHIVTIVGVALFLVFSFIGSYFKDGVLGMPILVSVGSAALFCVLAFVLRYAKSRDTDLKKWKIVEFSTLGVYLVLAILLAGPFNRFFAITSSQERIKEQAHEDVTRLRNLLEQFQNTETAFVETTAIGMQNAAYNSKSSDVEAFMNGKNTDTYREERKDAIEIEKEVHTATIDSVETIILQWRLFQVPHSVARIKHAATDIPERLTQFSKENNEEHPLIQTNANSTAVLVQTTPAEYEPVEVKLPELVESTTSITVLAILALLLAHFLILFCYIMGYRSNRVAIMSNSATDDDGILLKF